jgi:hypothetical protein
MNLKMEIIGIYGPIDLSQSRTFLEKTTAKVHIVELPLVMGEGIVTHCAWRKKQ